MCHRKQIYLDAKLLNVYQINGEGDDDDLDDAMQFVEKMRAGEDLVLAGGLGAGEERESLGGPTWSKVTSLP